MAADRTILVKPDGTLHVGDKHFQCALGRGGMIHQKKEGDGGTPIGAFPVRRVLYRADRLDRPQTYLPVAAIAEIDGWCDDPSKPDYNQQISFPFDGSAEHLWRDDHLYDVIVVLGHNDEPIIAGNGSAIFMHVAKPDYSPTEGCVALALDDLLTVLKDCSPDTTIRIGD